MSQLVGKLKAKDANGRVYDIHVYRTIVDAPSRGNLLAIAQSGNRFVTASGIELTSIDEDTLEVSATGERLTIIW